MPLAPEMVYNDLNGEEVREILLTRFADLLSNVPEFKRHLTLNRVQMTLDVKLRIFGRTPPAFSISDSLTLRTRENPEITSISGEIAIEEDRDLTAEINSDTTAGGQPPDLVREEHGIPVQTVSRGPLGYEDKPVIRHEGVKYAAFVNQDYGPARQRTGQETPVGGGVISMKNTHGGRPEAKPDFSKVLDPEYKEDK